MTTLVSHSLDHDTDLGLDLEPLTDSGNAHDQQLQTRKATKRQRKNVLIVNFLAVLLTLGIFSILLEYTAIADRTRARTAGMHRPSHLTSDGGDENVNNGGATHLYTSVVDVYDEDDEDQENLGEGTPLPSLAYQQNLPLEELLQLNQLYDACMTQNNTLIDGTASSSSSSSFPFSLSESAPAELLLKTLRMCPDVDVFVPTAARGDNEFCQDAAVYTKFLQSRMLPRWVLDVELRDEGANATVTYFDLCPKTPMLFLNHHWDALPLHPKWSNQKTSKKPVYLMPNIDSIELQREHLLAADVVLCKTKLCFSRVSAWYAQEAQRGTTIATKVLYTRHTSPNPSVPLQAKGVAIQQKDYTNPSFVHFAGDDSSDYLKGTRQVLGCWLSRPELPQLTILMSDAAFKASAFDTRIHSSGNVILDTQGSKWSQRMAEASFLLVPSESESYGHTINQARSTGGVVITTDVAPMNELIPQASGSGVLIRAKRRVNPKQLLGSGFNGGADGLQGGKGLVAEFSAKNVCDAVDALLHTTQEQTRQALGVRAHYQYYADTAVFAAAMAELRAYARASDEINVAALASSPPPATRVPPEGVQRLGNLRVDTAGFSIPPPPAAPSS